MTKLRADAQRNREALLGAASECFSEQGLHASVDEIARRAGVGHGTVFRRFPTKEALLLAVLEQELDKIVVVAQAAAVEADAEAAFESFFRAVADAYARNLALVEGFEHCVDLPQKQEIDRFAQTIVRRAQKAGALRRDLTTDQIFELVPAASRFPDVILDGLRPPALSG